MYYKLYINKCIIIHIGPSLYFAYVIYTIHYSSSLSSVNIQIMLISYQTTMEVCKLAMSFI